MKIFDQEKYKKGHHCLFQNNYIYFAIYSTILTKIDVHVPFPQLDPQTISNKAAEKFANKKHVGKYSLESLQDRLQPQKKFVLDKVYHYRNQMPGWKITEERRRQNLVEITEIRQ